jgi:hypothetical protein
VGESTKPRNGIQRENDEVRMLTVTIAPRIKEPFHAHRYASVIYDESPSHLVEYLMDGTKVNRGVRTQGRLESGRMTARAPLLPMGVRP